jgi:hypothetical protein
MVKIKLTPEQEAQALKFALLPIQACPSTCGICHPTELTRRIERKKHQEA